MVVIDYFSRWIEAESFATLKAKQMVKFIEKSLICRYGVPHHIVTDNGVQFQAETAEMLQKYGIKHHKSSPYRPRANGAVEAANKNVKRILSKV